MQRISRIPRGKQITKDNKKSTDNKTGETGTGQKVGDCMIAG